jgi:hypothetical protein
VYVYRPMYVCMRVCVCMYLHKGAYVYISGQKQDTVAVFRVQVVKFESNNASQASIGYLYAHSLETFTS